MSLSNFGTGLYSMFEHERSAYAVQSSQYNNSDFARGSPLPEISLNLDQELAPPDEQPASPSATSAPITIERRNYNTYTPSYHGSPQPATDPRAWQQSAQLDSMYESDFLGADSSYQPDFDRSPLSHASSVGHPSPYLNSAEDFLSNGLFNVSNPAFYVQPPTRNNTVLSPPLNSLDVFRYGYQKPVSPESSVGDDHLTGDPNDLLFGHRSRTHSRASSISSSHTQGLSASHYGTGTSTSPALVPVELSPHLNNFDNLQLVDNQWGGFHMQSSTTSGSNGSETGSGVPSPYTKPQSPPALVIPNDHANAGFDPSASLFDASQPGLAPPQPPSLGLIPATPVTPPTNQPKLGFQEILRQQVAQRRAASPLLQQSDTSGSQSQSPPNVPDNSLQQAPWSTLLSQDLAQPPMPPMPPVPSMSESNIFPSIGGARPAIGAIPSGTPGLGIYTSRTRSHSDPPSSQWGAALPPAIRPSPTHGQGNGNSMPSINLPSVNPNILSGGRVSDVGLGIGGSLWDNAIDPMLGGLGPPSGQRARSVGDANNRRGHIRNARSEDMSSSFRIPELNNSQFYTAADGSLAPPSMSVPSSMPADMDEGGVGPRRRGHERTSSGSHRASPYHSPHASPRMLPEDSANYGGINLTKPVERVHVTTPATREASSNRRTAQANFKCPVPGCGSTFTRHFNLRGHIRSHNEERPFKCKWPGCDKGFARQHDCKRHEALHLNIRPYTCEGCQKTFARMDALNRHLRSEGGTECQRVQSELTEGSADGNVVL